MTPLNIDNRDTVPRTAFHEQPLRRRDRKGSAVVELSVCLPLLILIALATIEACGMIYLKQSLKIAAYEGSRVGLVDGAEVGNVLAQADLILANRNVQLYNVALIPGDPAALAPGDYLRVSVTAPCEANSLIGGWFFQSKSLSEHVEVVKE